MALIRHSMCVVLVRWLANYRWEVFVPAEDMNRGRPPSWLVSATRPRCMTRPMGCWQTHVIALLRRS